VNTLRQARVASARAAAGGPRENLILDRFRLLEPLGSGGHGTVWAAHDERLGRTVALKRIPRGTDAPGTDDRRIGREALAAARLSHPAIVAFHEAITAQDAFYLVSELVEGASLAQRYARNRPDERELAAIGVALAGALAHAHARGVVHRDVKPQNVIIPTDPDAHGALAKLTDFGVATIAGEQPLTLTGDVIGTLAYMSPEQAHGQAATPASDLYALALTLYEGFAGHNPLRGATAVATVKRLGHTIAPLSAARPDLPRRLTAAIDRALDRDPARRGTVGDLRAALATRDAGTGPATARMPVVPRSPRGRPSPSTSLTPRGERLVGALTAAALTAVALATLFGPHRQMTVLIGACSALLLTAVAPRAGWLAVGFAAACALAIGGRLGLALVVVLALVPVPVLLARAPWLWSAAGAAPALGAIGLAGAFPALGALCAGGSWRRRAAVAVLGYWWTSLSEAISGRRLLFGAPAAAHVRAGWIHSLTAALDRVVAPLLTPGRMAPALLWAVAAIVLPWLLRSAVGLTRGLIALAWAGALIGVSSYLADRLGASGPPLALAAAALAAALAFSVHPRRGRAERLLKAQWSRSI
jgi:hypothetical protein